MAYFRQLDERTAALLSLFKRDENWLILINADPDALASAMALRRIMARKVAGVTIAHINEISRPDNLTMIKTLRIPARRYRTRMGRHYQRFAMVDSQPHHNELFEDYEYSIILDHHPVSEHHPPKADYVEIKPEYGACSTLLTEYLYNLKIKPATLLATSLLYGIKSDTASFERNFCDTDVKAFRYLSKHANHMIIKKIVRSEYKREWLAYFSRAINAMQSFKHGCFTYMGEVENPDILVILADFFLKVHEISWTVVAGTSGKTLVAILRGDGIRQDVGKMAKQMFGDVGRAGGHLSAARAEIELADIPGNSAKEYLVERVCAGRTRECSDKLAGRDKK